MLIIKCPHCGEREQEEFTCGGEAHIVRPKNPPELTDDQWADYLFIRQNIILGAPPYALLKSVRQVHKYYDTIMNPTHIYDDDKCKSPIEDAAFKSQHKNNTELLDFIFGCCEWDQHIRTTPTQAIKKLRHIRENPHS